MVKICCKNTNNILNIARGSSLFEIFLKIKGENTANLPQNPVCAKVNNRVASLDYKVFSMKDIEFLDLTSPSGQRTYARTLFFILTKAVHDLYPEASVRMCNAISNGVFCEVQSAECRVQNAECRVQNAECRVQNAECTSPNSALCTLHSALKSRMQEIIAADHKIQRHEMRTEEAIEKFRALGMESKVKLLSYTGKIFTTVYEIDGYFDYFYGALLPQTSMVTLFGMDAYHDGILLRVPSMADPTQLPPMTESPKLHETFKEYHRWQDIIGIRTIGDFNEAVEKGFSTDLINISEALQEKKISQIAESIVGRKDVKIVLIAGPSSSGKTSTCKRLGIQLITCGKRPLQISLDDYFVDRDKNPKLPNGDYDYESIHSLNLELFNRHLAELLEGKDVRLPRYNFLTGKSEMSDKTLRMGEQDILVIEGIHALNPMLTAQIDNRHIFRVYASALTSILLDEHNYIPTTDNRLLRRIVRDAKTRGCDARETIRRWPSVRDGENKWIFPYQENADAIFNTAMLFELAMLKNQAEPMLEGVPENCPEYSEAYRLLKFLRYIPKVPDMHLPPTSLLREFLGGSSFEY